MRGNRLADRAENREENGMKPEVYEIQRDSNQAMNLAQETILRGAAMPWVGKRPKITRWDRVRIWFMRLGWSAQ